MTIMQTENPSAYFKISNCSERGNNEDVVLLFKVRRAEPRLVSFVPKEGIVEPGAVQQVMRFISGAKHCKLMCGIVKT